MISLERARRRAPLATGAARLAERMRQELELQWLPARAGVVGNGRADDLAAHARRTAHNTALASSEGQLGEHRVYSVPTVKSLIHHMKACTHDEGRMFEGFVYASNVFAEVLQDRQTILG
ncbi:hypothetical protein HPB47_001364 [Ixodes persulcatus]|uniref:Uncharacterized protein n=1 Tax=Ixodes persulcatus TaxID=34615 RepID=A0AC60PP84_IXOPE|nr:hypothetical protein HPB47_001364 [Ixodes persulcatus]